MKIRAYKILFGLVSFLVDKTNGMPTLVNYKIILGTIIITLTGTSCNTNRNPYATCYDVSMSDSAKFGNIDTIQNTVPDEANIMCYKPSADEYIDSTETNLDKKPKNEDTTI